MLCFSVLAADPAPPLFAGSPNAALVAALSGQDGAVGRAKVAELLTPPPELMQLARSLGLPAVAPSAAAASSTEPSCSKSSQMINSAADLMSTLRQPQAQRLMVEMSRDERALQWVMERTRESLADPARFLELLANPSTANLLTALRADARLLPEATQCPAGDNSKQQSPRHRQQQGQQGQQRQQRHRQRAAETGRCAVNLSGPSTNRSANRTTGGAMRAHD